MFCDKNSGLNVLLLLFSYFLNTISHTLIYSVAMWAVYKIINKRVRPLLAHKLASELGKVTIHNVDYIVDVSRATTLIGWMPKYPEKPHQILLEFRLNF